MKGILFWVFGVWLFAGTGLGWAQSSSDPLQEALSRIQAIEQKAQRIEENQKEILAQQDKILAEIGRVRVWTHRN